MGISPIQIASCRMALAAFLHDLGKFAERARLSEAQDKDNEGNTRQAINELLYCPEFAGRRTHIHTAYTAIGMDLLEKYLPELVGGHMAPFAPWREKSVDDSIINAAAKHHRPDTFLQWIIATADRLASGFERESFDNYNAAANDETRPLNHYTTRQWTLLEGIHLFSSREESKPYPRFRYPLAALSPKNIFPVLASDCEQEANKNAQAQYRALWEAFKQQLESIPPSHRSSFPLWLDHFESLWLTFTHAIPSATVGEVKPDVSLYDHSKTTAALAVALWRYHADKSHDPETIRQQLRAQWDKKREGYPESKQAWEKEKFLFIQGDFFGIQNFIFTEGSLTQKRAAKLLRGRSFYVSLLTELAALKVLDCLELPATSQVINAAGKFLIVAHHTPAVIERLHTVQAELDSWFLKHTYGQSGIGLAWLPAAAEHFRQNKDGGSPFRELMKRLFERLEAAKLKRFQLCGERPAAALFEGFLDRFIRERGECRIDGRSPASQKLENDVYVSPLAYDQIRIGEWLVTHDRLLVTHTRVLPLEGQKLKQPDLPIFGYHLLFTPAEERTGKFGAEAKSGNLHRAWDFSLPESAEAPLWNGYARRHINAYVPRFTDTDLLEAARGKYDGLSEEDRENERQSAPKTLSHLAWDDRTPDPGRNDRWRGEKALMILKGDVDNLGLIFQSGLKNPTFAKMAALSRQLNVFFAVYLPWLCRHEFPNTYTVFAGGDDFFLIGPWYSTLRLTQRMKDDFRRYVAENPDIHFSAGLSMTKPGLPIRQLAQLAEKALEKAKAHNPDYAGVPPKNAITCFDQAVSWDVFDGLMARETGLRRLDEDHAFSTGYLYGLLHLTDMAAKVNGRPENAIWHAYFAYRTRRLAETKIRSTGDFNETERKRRRLQANLAKEIANEGIEQHGAAYKIALFTYLYQQRD
jgi:CRISPR-associated protein Csm1